MNYVLKVSLPDTQKEYLSMTSHTSKIDMAIKYSK
jgi:hypothetical protein